MCAAIKLSVYEYPWNRCKVEHCSPNHITKLCKCPLFFCSNSPPTHIYLARVTVPLNLQYNSVKKLTLSYPGYLHTVGGLCQQQSHGAMPRHSCAIIVIIWIMSACHYEKYSHSFHFIACHFCYHRKSHILMTDGHVQGRVHKFTDTFRHLLLLV